MSPDHPRDRARRIAIIGGGLSGITAAYELAVRHPDQSFTLFEASGRLGGTVETVHDQGFIIEAGPDSWVSEKPWARGLAEELGLASEIIPSNDYKRRTYIVRDRQLLPMPDGLRMMVPTRWEPVLHSPLISWEARLAYLREPKQADHLKATSLHARGPAADESVADFVLRHFGPEVSTTLAGPLLSGVFGGDIAKLSVRAVMAPFVRMEAEHGSLIEAFRLKAAVSTAPPSATFTTLATGLGTLIDRLVDKLPPAAIRLHTPITALNYQNHLWQLRHAGGTDSFDSILLCTPAHVTRPLLCSMQHTAATSIASLLPTEASSALVVALGYTREKAQHLRIPQGFGFLVPQAPSASSHAAPDLLACTFVDQKFTHRAPPGGILLRGFFGGTAANQLQHASADECIELTRTQLSRLLGPLPLPDVHLVRHWPSSLPQYFTGHVSRMQQVGALVQQLPGLELLGNAYHGVGLPDLVRDARRAVIAAMSIKAAFTAEATSPVNQTLAVDATSSDVASLQNS